jgi:hypothetical protein
METPRSDDMKRTLIEFLRRDAPQQFVLDVLFEVVARACTSLNLPEPAVAAGNIVIGDLPKAEFVLSAHLDEASFSVTAVRGDVVSLAACHRFAVENEPPSVTFLGFRNGQVRDLGSGELELSDIGSRCGRAGDIRLGDRAVYRQSISSNGNLVSAKAIDDRMGAVIALYAAAELIGQNIPVAVVLSDGEQNLPDGYFSRTFPHVLGSLHEAAIIIFADGIFQGGLEREGFDGPQSAALIVPHSGDGRGYTVPPKLFSFLRDEVIPRAVANGIEVRISAAYHSRGDDWGMVTNPTSGADYPAFFVSFGGWGDTPERRVVDTRSMGNCVAFIAFAVHELRIASGGLGHGRLQS